MRSTQRDMLVRHGRNAFTLVELLVVIAIISVLAALLLPSIAASLEQARRIACLNDRRQNMLALASFAQDHADRVPSHIRFWQFGERDLDTILTGNVYAGAPRVSVFPVPSWLEAGVMQLKAESNSYTMQPLGILTALQYFPSAETVMCHSFPVRTQVGYNRNWITGAGIWKKATNWNDNDFNYWYISFGVSQYLSASHGGTVLNNPRLRHYGQWYQESGVSPMLFSCPNYGYGSYGSGPTIARAHEQQGVNGAFFDASARWIGLEEIDPNGVREATWGPAHMVNDTPSGASSLQTWARSALTLGRK